VGGSAVAAPTGWRWVWSSRGVQSSAGPVPILLNTTYWEPIPPPGYTAVGGVFVLLPMGISDGDPWWEVTPQNTEIWCLRNDLVESTPSTAGVWSTAGVHGGADFALWTTVVPPGKNAQDTPTIWLPAGVVTSQSPAYLLKPPMAGNPPSPPPYPPALTSTQLVPESAVGTQLDGSVTVPYTVVPFDSEQGAQWMAEQSPFYTVQRYSEWWPEFQYYNKSTLDQPGSVQWTTGITDSASETFSKETGISLTASAGIELEGITAGASVTINEQLGYSTTSAHEAMSSKDYTVPFTVPAGVLGVLWMLQRKFRFLRGVGSGGTEVGIDQVIKTIESTVDQYPQAGTPLPGGGTVRPVASI